MNMRTSILRVALLFVASAAAFAPVSVSAEGGGFIQHRKLCGWYVLP